jgi:hypothetical protein
MIFLNDKSCKNLIFHILYFLWTDYKMEENNCKNKDIFYQYPKSSNHKIYITKKDNIKICDLSSKCTELNFSINKFNKNKIFNDNNIDSFACINFLNYDLILLCLIIILFITLKFISKK